MWSSCNGKNKIHIFLPLSFYLTFKNISCFLSLFIEIFHQYDHFDIVMIFASALPVPDNFYFLKQIYKEVRHGSKHWHFMPPTPLGCSYPPLLATPASKRHMNMLSIIAIYLSLCIIHHIWFCCWHFEVVLDRICLVRNCTFPSHWVLHVVWHY